MKKISIIPAVAAMAAAISACEKAPTPQEENDKDTGIYDVVPRADDTGRRLHEDDGALWYWKAELLCVVTVVESDAYGFDREAWIDQDDVGHCLLLSGLDDAIPLERILYADEALTFDEAELDLIPILA